jgi:hypothetical protein
MRIALRGFVISACAGLGLVTGMVSASADTIVTQPFAADSGDSCGQASGKLGWHTGPIIGNKSMVDVSGTLVDRPLLTDPSLLCRDDRISVVTFTAFNGKTVVDTDAAKADNERATFTLQLSAGLGTPIDRVVVQVCRRSASGAVVDYCGKAAEYKMPVVPVQESTV